MNIKKVILAVFSVAVILTMTGAKEIELDWNGKLRVSNSLALQLRIHISPEENKITMDSPDQGVTGIKGDLVHLSDDSLAFRIPALGVAYSAGLRDGKFQGNFQQGNATLPLILEPGSGMRRRPQTPQPPFPYTSEDVVINNEEGGAVLSATLTLPENCSSETPVAILVSGSGLQDRDETLFEHKPFAVLADALARNGIASIRYDDRGFGKSTGDAATATTDDFASDTRAVMEWLRRSGRFGAVGIIGHSEGGQIAYMLGAGEKAPDYIVSIAGPVVKGTETIVYQNGIQLLRSGVDADTVEKFCEALKKVFEYKLEHPEVSEISGARLLEFYPQSEDSALTRQLSASLKNVVATGLSNPWMAYFLRYDPASDVRSLRIPTFMIFGEKDLQVAPSLNEVPARSLAPSATVTVYPGLNHLMQHAATGNVDEYAGIEETMSEDVINDVVTFIKHNAKAN